MTIDLPLVWALILAFAVFAYVVMDGFDLGVGILFPLLKGQRDRDTAMNSVAPVWDGNETWLVLGGGGLMAAFPLAYAVLLPALYAPIIIMLFALIFRGVAFEFRWRTVRAKHLWSLSFFGGSLVAALCQGIALGAIVQGIAVEGRAYAGGWWDWLTPFSVMTGVALIAGYALLGSTWLIMKATGELKATATRFAWISGAATVGLIGVVSLWTPLLNPAFWHRWFNWPASAYTVFVPLLTGVCILLLVQGLRRGYDTQPFLASLGLFLLSYVGLAISLYPDVVPPDLTIWRAAAPDDSLAFLLVGAIVLIPLILGYTAYSYWVFRGKTDPHAGYH